MKHTLDVRGLLCPIPVIRTQNKVRELAAGDTLEILATDPGAASDIPAWCRVHGYEFLGVEKHHHELILTLRVPDHLHQKSANKDVPAPSQPQKGPSQER